MYFSIVLLIALIVLSAFREKLPGLSLKWAWLAWLAGQAWRAAFVLIPTVAALTKQRYRMKIVEDFGSEMATFLCAGLLFLAFVKWAKREKDAAE